MRSRRSQVVKTFKLAIEVEMTSGREDLEINSLRSRRSLVEKTLKTTKLRSRGSQVVKTFKSINRDCDDLWGWDDLCKEKLRSRWLPKWLIEVGKCLLLKLKILINFKMLTTVKPCESFWASLSMLYLRSLTWTHSCYLPIYMYEQFLVMRSRLEVNQSVVQWLLGFGTLVPVY